VNEGEASGLWPLVRIGLKAFGLAMFVAVPCFWLLASFQWVLEEGKTFSVAVWVQGAAFYYLGGFFWSLAGSALYGILVALGALLIDGRSLGRALPFVLTPAIPMPLMLAGEHLAEFALPALASSLLLGWLVGRASR
jgi:hypothetical protein